jgi:hypothetical protein
VQGRVANQARDGVLVAILNGADSHLEGKTVRHCPYPTLWLAPRQGSEAWDDQEVCAREEMFEKK